MRFRIALLFVFGCLPVAYCGENWPQFRGPDGNGVSDATGLPLKFSDTENVRWKTPIHGKGWSSPAVWDDQVWLTTATEDGKEMFAICVDLASGKILHDIKLWDVAEPQAGIDYNSYASPTPVIETGRVYVHFGAHGTAAIDTATGEILWNRQDLPCNHFRGAGSSPILFNNLLVLTFDGYDLNYLVALDKRTGETVWKRNRNITSYDRPDNGDYHKAFSTPQVIDGGGRKELVSPSAGATIAYDPATGNELWRVRSGGMNAAARPIFGNGLIYCTSADGGWQLFALKPGGSGDVSESHLVWKFNKNVSKRPSPLLVGDLLFMVSDHSGIVTCVDAKEGKLIWQHRLGGDYCASPIYADGRIYLFEVNGNAPVIAAGREFNLLAENHLESGSMASPAVVRQSLIVRTKTDLYRIEQPK